MINKGHTLLRPDRQVILHNDLHLSVSETVSTLSDITSLHSRRQLFTPAEMQTLTFKTLPSAIQQNTRLANRDCASYCV